jgi:flagellin-like protein
MQKFFGIITLLAGIGLCIFGIVLAADKGESGIFGAIIAMVIGFILVITGFKVMSS